MDLKREKKSRRIIDARTSQGSLRQDSESAAIRATPEFLEWWERADAVDRKTADAIRNAYRRAGKSQEDADAWISRGHWGARNMLSVPQTYDPPGPIDKHTTVMVDDVELEMLNQLRSGPPVEYHGVPAFPSGNYSGTTSRSAPSQNTTRSTSTAGRTASSNSTGSSNYSGSTSTRSGAGSTGNSGSTSRTSSTAGRPGGAGNTGSTNRSGAGSTGNSGSTSRTSSTAGRPGGAGNTGSTNRSGAGSTGNAGSTSRGNVSSRSTPGAGTGARGPLGAGGLSKGTNFSGSGNALSRGLTKTGGPALGPQSFGQRVVGGAGRISGNALTGVNALAGGRPGTTYNDPAAAARRGLQPASARNIINTGWGKFGAPYGPDAMFGTRPTLASLGTTRPPSKQATQYGPGPESILGRSPDPGVLGVPGGVSGRMAPAYQNRFTFYGGAGARTKNNDPFAGMKTKALAQHIGFADQMRAKGFMEPLGVRSAYRSPKVNKAVKGAKNSQHIHGKALDLTYPGMSNLDLARHAAAYPGYGFVMGYGDRQNPSGKHVHVDTRPGTMFGKGTIDGVKVSSIVHDAAKARAANSKPSTTSEVAEGFVPDAGSTPTNELIGVQAAMSAPVPRQRPASIQPQMSRTPPTTFKGPGQAEYFAMDAPAPDTRNPSQIAAAADANWATPMQRAFSGRQQKIAQDGVQGGHTLPGAFPSWDESPFNPQNQYQAAFSQRGPGVAPAPLPKAVAPPADLAYGNMGEDMRHQPMRTFSDAVRQAQSEGDFSYVPKGFEPTQDAPQIAFDGKFDPMMRSTSSIDPAQYAAGPSSPDRWQSATAIDQMAAREKAAGLAELFAAAVPLQRPTYQSPQQQAPLPMMGSWPVPVPRQRPAPNMMVAGRPTMPQGNEFLAGMAGADWADPSLGVPYAQGGEGALPSQRDDLKTFEDWAREELGKDRASGVPTAGDFPQGDVNSLSITPDPFNTKPGSVQPKTALPKAVAPLPDWASGYNPLGSVKAPSNIASRISRSMTPEKPELQGPFEPYNPIAQNPLQSKIERAITQARKVATPENIDKAKRLNNYLEAITKNKRERDRIIARKGSAEPGWINQPRNNRGQFTSGQTPDPASGQPTPDSTNPLWWHWLQQMMGTPA